jgi:hypothetical protein
MSNFLESKKIRAIIFILSGLIILFVVFGLGIAVGYDRAGFASSFDRNYYKNFYGAPPGGPVAIHGIVGTVIDVASSTLSLRDPDNNEKSVEISSGTVIRENEIDIVLQNITVGDHVAVIGEPNDQGQIFARFIRVFTASSTMPFPPPRQFPN